MIGLYKRRDSPLHRLVPGAKIAALAGAGTGLMFVADWRAMAGAFVLTAGLFALGRFRTFDIWRALRPILAILLLLAAAQLYLNGWQAALTALLRLASLYLMATLLTWTTPISAMMAAVETGLGPLGRIGVDTEKIALAMALALRFVPLLAQVAEEVRQAQRARGTDRHLLALAVPLIVRTLKSAHDIAEALDARGFGTRR